MQYLCRPSRRRCGFLVVSVLVAGLSCGVRDVLSYTRHRMQHFILFRDSPIIPLRRSPQTVFLRSRSSFLVHSLSWMSQWTNATKRPPPPSRRRRPPARFRSGLILSTSFDIFGCLYLSEAREREHVYHHCTKAGMPEFFGG